LPRILLTTLFPCNPLPIRVTFYLTNWMIQLCIQALLQCLTSGFSCFSIITEVIFICPPKHSWNLSGFVCETCNRAHGTRIDI
jgi:uncharacterized membrane protein